MGRLLVAAVAAVLLGSDAQAGQPRLIFPQPVTFEDIILLAESGLSDETLIAFLESRPIGFAPTAEDIVRLAEAGVSDRVIRYLLRRTALPTPDVLPSAGRERPHVSGGRTRGVVGTMFSRGVVVFAHPLVPHHLVGHHVFHEHRLHDPQPPRSRADLAFERSQRRIQVAQSSSRLGTGGSVVGLPTTAVALPQSRVERPRMSVPASGGSHTRSAPGAIAPKAGATATASSEAQQGGVAGQGIATSHGVVTGQQVRPRGASRSIAPGIRTSATQGRATARARGR